MAKYFKIDISRIEKMIRVLSINPAMHSIPELLSKLWYAIDEFNPDLLILHGLRTLFDTHGDREPTLSHNLNNALMLRRRGITTIYMYAAQFPKEHVGPIEFCDIVLILTIAKKLKKEISFNLIIWNSPGGKPRTTLNIDDLKSCFINTIGC